MITTGRCRWELLGWNCDVDVLTPNIAHSIGPAVMWGLGAGLVAWLIHVHVLQLLELFSFCRVYFFWLFAKLAEALRWMESTGFCFAVFQKRLLLCSSCVLNFETCSVTLSKWFNPITVLPPLIRACRNQARVGKPIWWPSRWAAGLQLDCFVDVCFSDTSKAWLNCGALWPLGIFWCNICCEYIIICSCGCTYNYVLHVFGAGADRKPKRGLEADKHLQQTTWNRFQVHGKPGLEMLSASSLLLNQSKGILLFINLNFAFGKTFWGPDWDQLYKRLPNVKCQGAGSSVWQPSRLTARRSMAVFFEAKAGETSSTDQTNARQFDVVWGEPEPRLLRVLAVALVSMHFAAKLEGLTRMALTMALSSLECRTPFFTS